MSLIDFVYDLCGHFGIDMTPPFRATLLRADAIVGDFDEACVFHKRCHFIMQEIIPDDYDLEAWGEPMPSIVLGGTIEIDSHGLARRFMIWHSGYRFYRVFEQIKKYRIDTCTYEWGYSNASQGCPGWYYNIKLRSWRVIDSWPIGGEA